MGAIDLAKAFGLTIRESANDGSDFTNPDADYRRLFLGEDGLLHLKDSSGTVTDIGSSGGGIAASLADNAGDTLVASANDTWAKLAKGSAGGALSMINAVVAWNSGTSFPGSVVTGDRYWRTDLGEEYYYDGTQWLSDTIYSQPFNTSGQSASFAQSMPMPGNPTATNVYGLKLELVYLISGGTALGGSHKWVGLFGRQKSDNSGLTATILTITIDSGASAAWRHDLQNINAVIAYDLTAGPLLNIIWTKTGTPGTMNNTGLLTYRKIAT